MISKMRSLVRGENGLVRTQINQIKDYFKANGLPLLIVIILTASITTILGYAIPAFGRFMRYLPQRVGGVGRMFKKWFYWRRYHPEYCFFPTSQAVIIQTPPPNDGFNTDPVYEIRIEMSLCIHNNDDFCTLYLNCEQGAMTLRMNSKIERRAQYMLAYYSSYSPYKVGALKEKVFDFVLVARSIDAKPQFGEEVHCDQVNIGVATLNRMRYKLKGKQFDVKVDWSKIQDGGIK